MKKILSRREALQEIALGFGTVALGAIMANDKAFGAESAMRKIATERRYDLTPKVPALPPRARNVIFLYMGGGPSTIDMFDPKPVLTKFNGKPAPFEIKGRALNGSQEIMANPWPFAKGGQNGREILSLLPYFQKVVDQGLLVRSMQKG